MDEMPRNLLAALLLLLPSYAFAGMDFDSMPVGCSWITAYSDGTVLRETYEGKLQGKHITVVYGGKGFSEFVRRLEFDSKGRLIKKKWSGGATETFAPYSCFSEVGECEYSYQNSDGQSMVIWNRVSKKGKGYKVNSGPKDQKPFNDEYFELGPFNIMTKNKSSNYSAKTTGFENCGPINS